MNYKTNKKVLSIIASGIFSINMFGCSKNTSDETLNTFNVETQPVYETENSEISETIIDENMTESTVDSQQETIETLHYDCPITYDDNIEPYYWLGGDSELFDYGFDNQYLQQNLIDMVYEQTGIYDDTLTIDNFYYFQYLNYCLGFESADSYMENQVLDGFILRTILSKLGLRYAIDEIPAWFIEQNFSDFMEARIQGTLWDLLENVIEIDDTYESYMNADDYSFRCYIFGQIISYNCFRASLVYSGTDSSYGGSVLQVRDETTGMIVLVPTETQHNQIQRDVNSIPTCENMSIDIPETIEEVQERCNFDINDFPIFDSLNFDFLN